MADLIELSPEISNFEIQTTLSNTEYKLVFLYNTESDYWTVSLYTIDGIPIIEGRRIIVGIDILYNCTNELKPNGQLVFIDLSNKNKDCKELDLGNDIKLVYIENT